MPKITTIALIKNKFDIPIFMMIRSVKKREIVIEIIKTK